MTYLITGAAGFMGSHLSDRLLAEGHRVICFDSFDNLYNPAAKWRNIAHNLDNPNFKLISGSIVDVLSLEKAFGCWGIDAVIHLAAQAGVRPSVQNPSLHSNVNVTGTVNVLEMCRQNKVAKIVFASSSSVYGNSPTPFQEDMPTNLPLCPYAATKKAGEMMCYTYHYLHGMDVACIRPFTVYGPRQRHDMAIPLFVSRINSGAEIVINGDGLNIQRDFTYVGDVVDGIVKILGKEHGFEIYNLGSGRKVCLTELVYAIESRLKKNAIIKYVPMGVGEATITYADISKAKERLGYESKYSIYEGLDKYIPWFLGDLCRTKE